MTQPGRDALVPHDNSRSDCTDPYHFSKRLLDVREFSERAETIDRVKGPIWVGQIACIGNAETFRNPSGSQALPAPTKHGRCDVLQAVLRGRPETISDDFRITSCSASDLQYSVIWPKL